MFGFLVPLQFASYHDTISSSQQMIHLGWELLTSNRPVASQCFLLTVWFSTHTFSILMTISQGLDVLHFNIFASWVTAQKNMGSLWQGFFSLTACRLLTNECLQNTVNKKFLHNILCNNVWQNPTVHLDSRQGRLVCHNTPFGNCCCTTI